MPTRPVISIAPAHGQSDTRERTDKTIFFMGRLRSCRVIVVRRARYDGSHNARLVASLIKMPWSRTAGCAHVGLSATEYLRTVSNARSFCRATIKFASGVRISQTEPAATMAALSPWRPSEVHSAVPSPGFRQKNWPRLRSEKPNSRSPLTTGELIYMEKSLFCQTVSVVHPAPRLSTLTPIMGLPMPPKISVSRYRTGVTMFCAYAVLNEICQSRSPVAAETPTIWSRLCVTTWRAPASSTTMGDAYAGPSPFQLHFSTPVATSKAVSAPCVLPPTCTMTKPRSTAGEVATPKSGDPNSLRHCGLPVLASKQESVPLMPKVKMRPSCTTGVDFTPLP